jgi:hypothetical protein
MPRPGGVSRYTRSYRPTTSRSRYADTGSNGRKNNTSRKSRTSSKAGMPTNIPKILKPAPKPTPYKKIKSPIKTVSTPKVKPKTTSVASKAGMPTNIPVNTTQKKQLPASKAGMPTNIPVSTIQKKQLPASKAGMPTNIPVNTKQKKQFSASKAGMPTDIQNRTTSSASEQSDAYKNKELASKYAKIYSKPSENLSATDISKGIKKELEDIRLSGSSMKPILPELNKKFAGKSINEMVRNNERIVLSEDEPIYLTLRSGKRIRIDNENYKKTKENNYRTLKIRNLLDKSNVQKKMNESSIGYNRANSLFLGINNSNRDNDSRVLGSNRTRRSVNKIRTVLPMAGVEKVLNQEEIDEPIRINSQYDYENYLKQMVETEPDKEFYQNILSSLQSRMRGDKVDNNTTQEVSSLEGDKTNSINDINNEMGEDEVVESILGDEGLSYIANKEVSKEQLNLDDEGNIISVYPSDERTIGYGYDIIEDPLKLNIDEAKEISQDYALELLTKVSNKMATPILDSPDITKELSQQELDGLVVLRYNIGSLGVVDNLIEDINENAPYDVMKNDIDTYYDKLVEINPSNIDYREGWQNRTNDTLELYFYGNYVEMPINVVEGVYND